MGSELDWLIGFKEGSPSSRGDQFRYGFASTICSHSTLAHYCGKTKMKYITWTSLILLLITGCSKEQPEIQHVDYPLRTHLGLHTLKGELPVSLETKERSLIGVFYLIDGVERHRYLGFGNDLLSRSSNYDLIIDTKEERITLSLPGHTLRDLHLPTGIIKEIFSSGATATTNRLPTLMLNGPYSDFRIIGGVFSDVIPYGYDEATGIMLGVKSFPTQEDASKYRSANKAVLTTPEAQPPELRDVED